MALAGAYVCQAAHCGSKLLVAHEVDTLLASNVDKTPELLVGVSEDASGLGGQAPDVGFLVSLTAIVILIGHQLVKNEQHQVSQPLHILQAHLFEGGFETDYQVCCFYDVVPLREPFGKAEYLRKQLVGRLHPEAKQVKVEESDDSDPEDGFAVEAQLQHALVPGPFLVGGQHLGQPHKVDPDQLVHPVPVLRLLVAEQHHREQAQLVDALLAGESGQAPLHQLLDPLQLAELVPATDAVGELADANEPVLGVRVLQHCRQ